MKAKRILKIVVKVAAVLAVLLIVLLLVVRMLAPGIVRRQIEKQGTLALGTPVTVRNVDLAILRGGASIKGIAVAQPEGLTGPPALSIGEVSANIALTSLMSDVIKVQRVSIADVAVNLLVTADGERTVVGLKESVEAAAEQAAKEKEGEPEPEPEPTPDAQGGKGILLSRFTLENVTVTINDAYIASPALESAIGLQSLVIEDVLVPPPGSTSASKIMKLALKEFSLDGPATFTQRRIVHVPGFELDVDVAHVVATGDQAELLIPRILNQNTRIVVQEARGTDTTSLSQFLQMMTNATSDELPTRLGETSTAERKVEEETERKGNFLARAASTASDTVSAAGETVKDVAAGEPKPERPAPEPAKGGLRLMKIESMEISDFQYQGHERDKMNVEAAFTLKSNMIRYEDPDPSGRPQVLTFTLDIMVDRIRPGDSGVSAGGVFLRSMKLMTDLRLATMRLDEVRVPLKDTSMTDLLRILATEMQMTAMARVADADELLRSGVDAATNQLQSGVGAAGEALKGINTDSVGEGLDSATEGVKDATRNVRGLLGGKKRDDGEKQQ